MRRRIQIWAFEKTRIRQRPSLPISCPICSSGDGLLTLARAEALLEVDESSIRRRLAQGKAHGVMTATGQLVICRWSLLHEDGPDQT